MASGPISRLRFARQSTMELIGEASLEPEVTWHLAELTASGVQVGELSIARAPDDPECEFQIMRGDTMVSTFEVIVSRDLGEVGKGEAGRRKVHASWSGNTEKRNDKLLGDEGLGALVLLVRWAFLSVPGFPAYEAFLNGFQSQLLAADQTASITIETT
jgi:hypothetical protein